MSFLQKVHSYGNLAGLQHHHIELLYERSKSDFTFLFTFLVDLMHDFAYKRELFKEERGGKLKRVPEDEQLLSATVYLLIRLAAFVVKSPQLNHEILWEALSPSYHHNQEPIPNLIKLVDAVMVLLFKPGYTVVVTVYPEGHPPVTFNTTGIDQQLVWCEGVGTMGEVYNKIEDT
mmetsp:Transcript_15381/g.11188  ORF Transcript_15381/g.11188 Transcript_15381/m.11188 type:complete len:175 (-) Transcript_15381:46-570(-)